MSDSSLSTWGWLRTPSYILLPSPFWYCCMWQTLRPQTQLTPPWTRATRPQTFHIKVNFRTCTDDQAAREWGLGSADPWDEDYCCAWRNGIANKERQSVNVGDFCLQTLSHRCCAWTWQSLSFGPKYEVSFFVIDTLTAHSAQPTYAVMITCGGRWQLFHSGVGL